MLALWEDRLEALLSRSGEVPLTSEPYTVFVTERQRAARGLASLRHQPAVAWSPSCPWDPVSLISETHRDIDTHQALSSSQGLSPEGH